MKKSNHSLLPTSVRLPPDLHQKLLQKAKDFGQLSLNKTIQELLEFALHQQKMDKHVQYTVMLYALMREASLSLVEERESLLDRADKKAAKILESFSSPLDA